MRDGSTYGSPMATFCVNAADVSSVGTDDYGAHLTLGPKQTVELDNEVVVYGHCLGCYSLNSTSTFQFIGIVQDQ